MRYQSTYIDVDGGSTTAVLEAPDEQALHEQLHRQGRTLVRVKPIAPAAPANSSVRLRPTRLLMFLESLQNALDAGVPLLSALAALREEEQDSHVAAVYGDLADRVAGGQTLSESLAAYPRSFPSVYCALVRVGESSGNLPQILGSMVAFMEWRIAIASTVKQATIYPAVVLTAGYGLVLFLLSFVIPKLGGVIEKIGSDLPPASKMLIGASKFVAGNVGFILLGTLLAVAMLVWMARTDRGRSLFAGALSHLPVAANVVRTLTLVQLCRNLAVLLQAGITIPTALEHAAAAVGLPRTRAALLDVRDRLLGGGKLTEAIAAHGILPPVALSMMRVGEESGSLPQAFARLGQVYDREVKDAVKRALGLLEPVVTVVLGIIVGGVAAVVISTIYSAMRGLGK